MIPNIKQQTQTHTQKGFQIFFFTHKKYIFVDDGDYFEPEKKWITHTQ